MKRKVIFMSLILVISFSMVSVANAYIKASEYISDVYANAIKYSDGRVQVSFDIKATDTMDVVGVKTIIIQEKLKGETSWTSVATLSSDSYSNMLTYNKRQHASNVTYYGAVSGRSYRAKVYFYAENGGYDTKEYITPAV